MPRPPFCQGELIGRLRGDVHQGLVDSQHWQSILDAQVIDRVDNVDRVDRGGRWRGFF
jgi:hypothetical protein